MKSLVRSLSMFSVFALTASPTVAEPSLRPWEENTWYWSYQGEPVLLLGGSDDDSLFQWQEAELIPHLDRMVDVGANVIRNTMSDRKDNGFEIYPFQQLEDGTFDLNIWNDEYWTRFERMLRETAKRKIFVQIEVWDRFDYTDLNKCDRWQIHPYNPGNNVNYTYKESGFAKRYPEHPAQNRQPFFFTTPQQRNNQVVLRYQQRFVSKMLEYALPFDHVLYCIDNETSGEEEWSRYWAEFINERALKKHKQVYITEMWDDWNLDAERHKRTFDHPELYGYVDVSQNNHNRGQKHWDNFQSVRHLLSRQPRPMNTTKIYGATGNKFGHTDQDGIERFWRHLLSGAASVRFHRPTAGLGLNDKAAACIRAARKLESLVPLWSIQPANDLLSDREANEAYLAADRGKAYVLYFPAGGEISLDASDAKGQLMAHWINIDTSESGPQQQLTAGGTITLSPPSNENWIAAIVAP